MDPSGAAPTWDAERLWTDQDLLRIRDLKTHFIAREGTAKAVDGIDLSVQVGRTLCIVGETGSGKSVTGRSIMRLVDPPGRIVSGSIQWRPGLDQPWMDLAAASATNRALRTRRGREIGMVFQEPVAALSPMYTIGKQFVEAIRVHLPVGRDEAWRQGVDALRRVRIADPEGIMHAYPFQLSGGMCQRAMIAIALCCGPSMLIADEPTTALDVTTQARILDLLRERQRENGMAMIFITHDLGVVAEMADTVAVMRDGRVVEYGPVDTIFTNPGHAYTRQLMAASSVLFDSLPALRRSTTPRTSVPGPERPAPTTASNQVLLEVRGLGKTFSSRGRSAFRKQGPGVVAAHDVSFSVLAGETFGIVGESGSGKTTVGRCIARAIAPTTGEILYRLADRRQVDLAQLGERGLRPLRPEIRLVLQDPFTSLNPRMTVLDLVGEPLRVSGLASGSELIDRVAYMLERVGLRRDHLRRYPHAFSGGQRQRINIARALVTRPRLVIADESVSALDVSVRAQILALMKQLGAELKLTYIFISHDLSVVSHMCERVAVMLDGEIVEVLHGADLFDKGQHPYTRELAQAVPIPDPGLMRARTTGGRTA